jgi:hypothetical protein
MATNIAANMQRIAPVTDISKADVSNDETATTCTMQDGCLSCGS